MITTLDCSLSKFARWVNPQVQDRHASAPALFRVIARVVCAYPDEPTLWTAPQQQPAQQQSAGQDADGAPPERALGELRAEIAEGWSYRMVLQLCDVADPTVRLGAILAGDEVYSPR